MAIVMVKTFGDDNLKHISAKALTDTYEAASSLWFGVSDRTGTSSSRQNCTKPLGLGRGLFRRSRELFRREDLLELLFSQKSFRENDLAQGSLCLDSLFDAFGSLGIAYVGI